MRRTPPSSGQQGISSVEFGLIAGLLAVVVLAFLFFAQKA